MPQNKNKLPGWPGYRVRENRSGLDYIDTQNEAAHMEGMFYRKLYTFQLRTRKPFYLILMFVFGVIPFLGSVALTWFVFSESKAWMVLIFPTLFTLPLTINFILSILEITHLLPSQNLKSLDHAKARKKKLPKRRKDFR